MNTQGRNLPYVRFYVRLFVFFFGCVYVFFVRVYVFVCVFMGMGVGGCTLVVKPGYMVGT